MKLMHQIWMILTLNCEDSARLTSASMDRPLNFVERWAISAHRLICARSRRLNSQMLDMNEAFTRSNAFDLDKGPMAGLSDDAKTKIRAALVDFADNS